MFRRLPDRLPEDHIFPADLDKLGYFINKNDQIRQKANPDQKYQYKINRNDRVNDIYKEAMNTCNRRTILERLLALGLEQLRLPLGASKSDKHVPILVSKDLATKRHVVVFFPERNNDSGVLSYRVMGEEGINIGSIVNFVRNILHGPAAGSETVDCSSANEDAGVPVPKPKDVPGIVIANPSELIWYRGGGRAVTDREWTCLPRKSAAYEAMRVDEVRNRIEGSKDFREHVHYIFEHILSSQEGGPIICHPEARLSIIGQEYVSSEALQYLTNNWLSWKNRISCVALINPQHTLEELFATFDPSAPGDTAEHEMITDFIARRTRAYRLSQKPLEHLLSGREKLGCNVFAAGETLYEESCFIRCWPSILDWIEMCRVSETYAEPAFEIAISDDEGARPKKGSPRNKKPVTEEEVEEARFHGELDVTEKGGVTKVFEADEDTW